MGRGVGRRWCTRACAARHGTFCLRPPAHPRRPSSPSRLPVRRPQRKVPHVLSLTDFMGWRFGWVAKTYVVLFCLFNMSIGAA